jgi:hypothetical protein
MPNINRPRTHVRVRRSDGREWPSVFVAYRDLLGTNGELGYSEHQRMRAAMRSGAVVRDRHGFEWRATAVAPSAFAQAVQTSAARRAAHVAQPTETQVAAQIHAQVTAFLWSDLTFGCELEVISPISMYDLKARIDAAGLNGWRVVGDGSVVGRRDFTGMEVVSPVLKGEDGLQKVRKVCDLLKTIGCKVNSTCGFHVHIGARTLSGEQLRKIAIAFLNNERNFDALVPAARLSNRYCRSNTAVADRSRLATANAVSTIATAMNGGSSPQRYNHYRYHKLNFQSFLQHGTIEFRQHGGTVQAEKACNWIRLIVGFCANAINQPQQADRAAVTFDSFLASSTDEEGVQYLTSRRNALAAAMQRAA